jgi:LPXTG-site transpeptidase (sortase) family protein
MTGVLALVAAGVLGVAALRIAGDPSGRAELSAPPASAPVSPSTIGPSGPPSPTVSTPVPAAAAPRAAAGTTTSTIPPSTTVLSPLSALVGEPVSVIPSAPVRPPAPASLAIPAIGVDVPIRTVGLQADGQLEIPDETEVGWYGLGSSPGEAGASVLAGHVSWNRTTGPFFRLAELEPGATIDIGLADGAVRTYEVVERAQYPKQALPVERIWATGGPETLVLITCGGAFNPEIHRYADNIVVYAVPIA